MPALTKHIILMGFKHVGKTTVGEMLAKKLCAPFLDLDQHIELVYEKKHAKKNTCREISQQEGENFFRKWEIAALRQVMRSTPCILSLGDGTVHRPENQRILKLTHPCVLIHITAQRGIVFERILMSGRPVFFNRDEDLLDSFNRLWDEREKIYAELKDFSIENNSSPAACVNEIINQLDLTIGMEA